MALRLFLLVLVGLMSFELPDNSDFEKWVRTGNELCKEWEADFSQLTIRFNRAYTGLIQPEIDAESAPAPIFVSEVIAEVVGDVQFENAMEGVASEFRGDLASIETAEPVPSEAPIVAGDPIVTPRVESENSGPGCFDDDLVGTDMPASLSCDSTVPIARLSTAVRLTREALSAWAALIDADLAETR